MRSLVVICVATPKPTSYTRRLPRVSFVLASVRLFSLLSSPSLLSVHYWHNVLYDSASPWLQFLIYSQVVVRLPLPPCRPSHRHHTTHPRPNPCRLRRRRPLQHAQLLCHIHQRRSRSLMTINTTLPTRSHNSPLALL